MSVELDEMRRLMLEGKYFFYTHALTEAKKDELSRRMLSAQF